MYLMLDFETLGSAADTALVSLGAVAFNREGVLEQKLFLFDLEDQVKHGRTYTAATIQWWMRQSDKAREVFKPSDKGLTIAAFFSEFETMIDLALKKAGESRSELKPVGNGANFDISILEDLYRKSHPGREHALPWKFWNVWCFRTFNHLTKCKDLIARPHGTAHSALDDALYQTDCMFAVWNKGKKK